MTNQDQVPRAKKIKNEELSYRVRKSKPQSPHRSVSVSINKEEMEEDHVCSCLTVALMTAFHELGVSLDVTIRENQDAYEVILEE